MPTETFETMKFSDAAELSQEILKAVDKMGFSEMTPVQAKTLPLMMEGRDIIAIAPTGTGKTCAFAVPILQRLTQHPVTGKQGKPPIRALILTPTRELAIQNQEQVEHYGKYLPLKSVVIYGGVGQKPQVDCWICLSWRSLCWTRQTGCWTWGLSMTCGRF